MTTKVITGKVRFSYVQVFTPRAASEGDKPKYSVCILIDKDDEKTLNKVRAAIDLAYKEGKAKFGGSLPRSWKNPLRDGDEERDDLPEFENKFFLNANSQRQPGLVDRAREDIIDEDEFYSGCFGRASINFFAFNTSGNKGVACGLNNLQKLADGERLSGSGTTAQEDFDDDFADEDGDDMLD